MKKISNYWFAGYILAVTVFYAAIWLQLVRPTLIDFCLFFAFMPVLIHAIKDLKEKKIGSEFFLVLATVIAVLGHEEFAITTILIIMLVAEYLEEIITDRTQSAIKSLIKLMPTDVTLKTKDTEQTISINKVSVGMQLVVNTGKRIPADGVITFGAASINESALTGESAVHEKTVGDHVFAGTFVESGSIIFTVEKIAQETFFGKISSLVQKAEHYKAGIATLADRVALYLIPAVILFIAVVWFFTHDIKLVITLLVFASPLELTLITPLAVLSGVAAAFGHGVLVKGGIALERLAHVDTIVFDKTGTLTMGDATVIDIQVIDSNYTKQDILLIAAIAEKRSDYALAQAVLQKAAQENLHIPDPQDYQSLAGHGVTMKYNGLTYFVGNKHFIEAHEHAGIALSDTLEGGFYTSFYVACHPNTVCGKIILADQIRPDAKQAINALQSVGIKQIILLSGDKQEVTQEIAKQLGISQAFGGMFPDQKIAMIEKLQSQGHKVAMVGDGINDAPALKQAHVGIAMGAMGTEPAIEAADIVLMTNDLHKIVFVYQLAKKTMQVIKQNIIFGFILIHIVGIILAFAKILNPVQAALLHAVLDFAILISSARLINFKEKR